MRERQKKYLVILGDGMADEPLAELGGKTPLEFARTPNMDRIAREGTMGLAGRRAVERKFSMTAMVRQYQDMYDRCLA